MYIYIYICTPMRIIKKRRLNQLMFGDRKDIIYERDKKSEE